MSNEKITNLTQLAIRFEGSFKGALRNYGLLTNIKQGEKGKLIGDYRTVKDTPITIDLYKQHLEGKVLLGIIPIDEENKCSFGVIDIDIYQQGEGTKDYIEIIEKERLPLVPFYSKSGGIHLYLFLREKVPAKEVRNLMSKYSNVLLIDKLSKTYTKKSVEIFPKQLNVSRDKRVGSFINLPYFNAENTKQNIISFNKRLNLTEGLKFIEEKRISLVEAQNALTNLPYNDAPSCLQSLYLLNKFKDSLVGRNNYLFSFGVYFKKKEPNIFEQCVRNINEDLESPLEENEIEKTIISSLKKKDYMYKCNDYPCVDFCNKDTCSEREFGVGKKEGYFLPVNIEKLEMYDAETPYFYMTVSKVLEDGKKKTVKIRFDTVSDLRNQNYFNDQCAIKLYEWLDLLKPKQWSNTIRSLFKILDVIPVEKEDDITIGNIVKRSVKEFILNTPEAVNKSQITDLGRVYHNNEKYYFYKDSLRKYLDSKLDPKYRLKNAELDEVLNKMGSISTSIKKEKGVSIRVERIPEESIGRIDSIDFKDIIKSNKEEENF
jgi:hypothetical protein